MEPDRRYLETHCPNLARDCDEAARPHFTAQEVDSILTSYMSEAYDAGFSDAEAKGLRVFHKMLLIALCCGVMGWAVGRFL